MFEKNQRTDRTGRKRDKNMSIYYTIDDIRAAWEKVLKRCQALKSAWENVEFPTKKDGTPFKVMSKNFKNARYETNKYAFTDCEKTLEVYTRTDLNGYISDEIKCYVNTAYMTDTQKEKPENIIKRGQCLTDLYIYDLDDIKAAIAERIHYYNTEIETYTRDIAALEPAFREFQAAYKAACTALEEKISRYQAIDIKDTVSKWN